MTVWDWLATGTPPTYLAVVVAAVAALFAYRSSNASRTSADAAIKQLKRLEDEREKEQASAVALWMRANRPLSSHQRNDGGPPKFFEYEGAFSLFYILQNLSAMPVYDAFVYTETDSGLYKVGHLAVAKPSSAAEGKVQSYFVASGIEENQILRLGLLFRDAQGFLWDRQPDGRLIRLTDAENGKKRDLIVSRSEAVQVIPPLQKSDRLDLYKVE